jgi:soluble lytic murein transglycosylase-like protein
MNKTLNVALGAYSAVKGSLAIIGLAALAAFYALPVQREALFRHLPLSALMADGDELAPPTAAGSIQASASPAHLREQRAVTEFISRRYRVSDQAVAEFVAAAYRAGAQYSVDPLLVLAVMAVESRYNPVAESTVGAKGLMQVIPKFHLEKLSGRGGEEALLDPEVNIYVGTQILREYQRRFRNTEAALQMYGGVADEPTSQYASKVLAEKARLDALRQKIEKSKSA